MVDTQLLDWDSEILGVPVAKILLTSLDEISLKDYLRILKADGIQLVYWAVPSDDKKAQNAAQACGGLLVDKKITYILDLNRLPTRPLYDPEVERYTHSWASAELIALAMEIAPFSRFSQDPNISEQEVRKLYTAWITNACKQQVARAVLVIRRQIMIAGMVVIADQKDRAKLSLIAVHPQYRRTGLGERLIHAAQAWSLTHGYVISQVVTQEHNPSACQLYTHCHYQREKMEYFYHFWLTE